jgi:hypothetical protein
MLKAAVVGIRATIDTAMKTRTEMVVSPNSMQSMSFGEPGMRNS